MGNKLVIKLDTWRRLTEHLLQDAEEHLAFVLVKHIKVGRTHVLLSRDLVLIQDEELNTGNIYYGLSLNLDILLKLMNRANKERLVLVEAHSHPFSEDSVGFSPTDIQGQEELFRHLQDVSPGRHYGALVIGQCSVNGLLWVPELKRPVNIHNIRVLGESIQSIHTSKLPGNKKRVSSIYSKDRERYDRQILALGEKGQSRIGEASVGIVGLGGIGSMVVLELAHLGVNHYILVEDDVVERTNLNRLVGATTKEVGRPKVEVAKEMIKNIKPYARITTVNDSVRSRNALKALKGADIIIGCVDTDSGRMILNELALTYLIPLIDCGVGIEVDNGCIVEAGGRVLVWIPGRPCLLCAREFNPRIAAEELESPEERTFRQEHGYVTGADVKQPAVISLNGIVASIAVTEFLALATGFRPSQQCIYHDMLEQRTVPRIVKQNSNCIACACEGEGEEVNIERYSKLGLPLDIPR